MHLTMAGYVKLTLKIHGGLDIHNLYGPHRTLYVHGVQTFSLYIVLCEEEDQNLLVFYIEDQ